MEIPTYLKYTHDHYSSHIQTPIAGDEDCLFINIYTPKVTKKNSNLHPIKAMLSGKDCSTWASLILTKLGNMQEKNNHPSLNECSLMLFKTENT